MRWVIVADSTRCRVFTQELKSGPFEEIDDLVRPSARLREHDRLTDRPGRAFDSAGAGRHAMERSQKARDGEARKFAHEIVERLDDARKENAIDGLVLIAEPQLLGLVREKLTGPLQKLIELEIPANLTSADVETIYARVADQLRI